MEWTPTLIYSLVLAVLTLFLVYNDLAYIKENKKKTSELKDYTAFFFGKSYVILYAVLLVMSIFLAIISKDVLAYRIIYILITLVCIMELVSAKAKYTMYYSKSNFFYDNELYRYKSISSIKQVKKWGRGYEVKTFNGKSFNMVKPVALKVQEEMKNK